MHGTQASLGAQSKAGAALVSLQGLPCNATPPLSCLRLPDALLVVPSQGRLTDTCVASHAAMCSATVRGSTHLYIHKRAACCSTGTGEKIFLYQRS